MLSDTQMHASLFGNHMLEICNKRALATVEKFHVRTKGHSATQIRAVTSCGARFEVSICHRWQEMLALCSAVRARPGWARGASSRQPARCGEGRGPKIWRDDEILDGGATWASPSRRVGHMSARRRDYESSRHIREPYAHVRDFMAPSVVTFTPDTPLDHVLPLFEEFSGFPVVDSEGKCIGVLSEKDVIDLLEESADQSYSDRTVSEFMTRRDPVTIREGAPILYAASLMQEHNIYRLPVTDRAGVVIGCISRADIFVSEDTSMGNVDPLYRAHPGEEFYNEEDMDFVDKTDI